MNTVRSVVFELPLVLAAGLPAALVLVALLAWRLRRGRLAWRRVAALAGCRALALAVVAALLARPVAFTRDDPRRARTVALLVDRSRSMGLADGGRRRLDAALDLGAPLARALEKSGWRVRPFLFDAAAAPAPLPPPGAAADGARTDLGQAVHHALATLAPPPPAAVVALTDGAANVATSNTAALQALADARAPLVAVGFGDDAGFPSLTLQRVLAPARVAPRRSFRVSAQLQAAGAPLADFDLDLLRDGRRVQSRRVSLDAGAATRGRGRLWLEGFDVREDEPGGHEYAVVARPVGGAPVVSAGLRGAAAVRIGAEKDFRVLYAQGSLTWDFKFIGRALRKDPGLRVTGLSRTSRQSVFRQNVESAGELAGGFPRDVAEIAPYRVLVLSDLKPADLSAEQQELVARFCAELGGGVLLLGGADTFDASWQGSRLEQLLPVTFDPEPGVRGLDRPFHLELTGEARRSPVFQVADDPPRSERIWAALPSFDGYGRVLDAKPGAVVWARHDREAGPRGRRVLIASHAYGAGLAAVVGVQNLWRWRLQRDSDVESFDRFWRQFFRFLGQAGREAFQIQAADQELGTGADIRVLVEKAPRPEGAREDAGAGGEYVLRVRAPGGAALVEQRARLAPLRPVQLVFRAAEEGVHTVSVSDPAGALLAAQPLDVRDFDREMERTARDMENLRQWAALSRGVALRAEDVESAEALARRVGERVAALAAARERREPVGLNPWVLALLLGALCGEWALRRRWELA